MLLAIVGIFLIVGLLGMAAFFCGKECGKEQLDNLLSDGQVMGRPPARRAHSN
jgi:hypothetical protein